MKIRDYYDVIGLGRDATDREIKNAYRALVLRWHPDRNLGDGQRDAETRFKEITEAYEVLSDPEKRRRYDLFFADDLGFDREGRSCRRGGGVDVDGTALADLFGSDDGEIADEAPPFEDGFGEAIDARRIQPRSGPVDVRVECRIGVSLLVVGRIVPVRVPIRILCLCGSSHHGGCVECETGSVPSMRSVDMELPDEAFDGMTIRLDGMGSIIAGESRDLIVTLRIESDSLYRVDGRNVHSRLTVASWEAATGVKVGVRSPAGDLLVKVPKGSAPGTRLRLAGKGLPDATGVRGDYYLTLHSDVFAERVDRRRAPLRAIGTERERKFRGVRIDG